MLMSSDSLVITMKQKAKYVVRMAVMFLFYFL